MTAGRWDRVEKLFHEASGLGRDERARYFAGNTADDTEILREVQLLLAADETSLNVLDQAIAGRDALAVAAALELPDTLVGPYRLIKLIGKGGMGAVYLAERIDKEFEAQVAIKLVRADRESPEIVARFRAERQILASLIHPNIAGLYDGGITAAGTSWFAMEYVDGIPITEYCLTQRTTLRARLTLFQQICAAVGCAHHSLVVHRDIKPGNILVTPEGVPKLLDFGIARILCPSGQTGQPGLTRTGERVLTPEYAAPEQILNRTITVATDVYALGVLLYELLTGLRPFGQTTSAYELDQKICLAIPARPSQTLSATPDHASRLKGDLDSIVMMALRKDPAERYSSVERFSTDIDNYLGSFPVAARRGSLRYRGFKFIRRNWLSLSFAVAGVLAVPLGLLTTHGLENMRMAASQAEALAVAGRALDAEGLYNESQLVMFNVLYMERRVVLTAPAHNLIAAYGGYAASLGHAGKLGEAETTFREGIAAGLQSTGESPELSALWSGLAAVRREQGAYGEAQTLYRKALTADLKLFGHESLPEARDLCGLGGLLARDASSPRAEQVLTRCLAIRSEKTGAGTMETAEAEALLADLRTRQQRFDEAAGLYRHAIAADRQQFPGGHPQTATHLLALGRLMISQGRSLEAAPLAKEALGVRRHFFPGDSWRIAEAENVWGGALFRMNRKSEAARPLLERTLASLLRNPGPLAEATQLAYGPID